MSTIGTFVFMLLIIFTSAQAQFANTGFLRSSMGCKATPFGNIANNASMTAYSSTLPSGPCSAVSETRTCHNTIFSGSFPNSSCMNGCTGTPWGNVASGYSNTAYAASNPASACSGEARTCTNGSLSGSYTATSCVNGCTGTPWGNVASGYSNTAYAASSAPDCGAISQSRSCSNGTMSGSYSYTSCTPAALPDCNAFPNAGWTYDATTCDSGGMNGCPSPPTSSCNAIANPICEGWTNTLYCN